MTCYSNFEVRIRMVRGPTPEVEGGRLRGGSKGRGKRDEAMDELRLGIK